MSDEVIQDDAAEVADGEPGTAQAVESEESATSENGSVESQEGETDNAPAKPKGVQKRIDELTHNWRSAERDRDYWRDLAVRNQSPDNPQPKQQIAQQAAPPPTLEGVGFDEAVYQQKMVEWVQGNIEAQFQAREQQAQQQTAEIERQQRHSAFQQKAGTFAAKAADYYDVAHNPSLPVSDVMADAITQMDDGPQVLYHLGKNPQEAARISQLPANLQALELGRLEARLSLPQPKTASNSPPPIKPLNAGGESVTKSPDEMTTKEWLEWRNKQLRE